MIVAIPTIDIAPGYAFMLNNPEASIRKVEKELNKCSRNRSMCLECPFENLCFDLFCMRVDQDNTTERLVIEDYFKTRECPYCGKSVKNMGNHIRWKHRGKIEVEE